MTNQEEADALLAEHWANRGRTMVLSEWDKNVRPHLNFISAGADMAARHASQLPIKPDFRTAAQDDLAEARAILETALQNIIGAQAQYENRPSENERAA